ncbi:hypothetical protein SASPL_133233 [Salvia splendens]|uniref:Disease resistance protein RPM1 n=1 Tax=Salvia splendens TaxID=180675 RepID=A0A8X8ZI48_SALSN|nr:hypothetical protein SASPL_133233 [Salvia splendens]
MDIPTPYWKSFKLLKILYLDGFRFTKLPKSLRCLLGLKYLRIHPNIIPLKLLSWFPDFKKLEFLYVECVEFSDVAMKMESLRDFGTYHVYGRAMKVEKWKSIESLKGIRLVDLVDMSSGLMPNSHLPASVFPPNLSRLALAGIKDILMEELGKLPKLQYLTLNHSRVSEHFSRMKILQGGFPCLKALSL